MKQENMILMLFVVTVIIFTISCGDDVIAPENTIIDDPIVIENNNLGWYYSENLRDRRFIYIRLPQNYDSESETKYHTVYLTDANWYFDGSHERIGNGGAVGVIDRLVEKNSIPDVILVGIGNENTGGQQMRGWDFHSSKTEKYLDFITQDLIPIIDERFNTDTNDLSGRTLIGHSSGGYFNMYALFHSDNPTYNKFHNFITLSTYSADYHPKNLFEMEESLSERIGKENEFNFNLFLGVGELEEDRFLDAFKAIKDSLNSRQYTNFHFESKVYPNHGHSSYLVEAFKDGLTFIFK